MTPYVVYIDTVIGSISFDTLVSTVSPNDILKIFSLYFISVCYLIQCLLLKLIL